MVSAFADMDEAVPHLSSSAASQKAKFSPGVNTNTGPLDPAATHTATSAKNIILSCQ